MINAYPLQWPPSWPRSEHLQRARFDTTQNQAQHGILLELRRLGASDVVISTNIEIRRDGMPYARQLKANEDPGVAVYFKLKGEQQCIPCDKWSTVADNMQAIRKTIEALRGLERWGAKEMVNAAFRGFKALPESVIVTPNTSRAWYEVLGVSQDAPRSVIDAAYRALAKTKHPDGGGSESEFLELANAYKEATS